MGDRAEAYAEGARTGAPQAQQVADRFHLLQNATKALNEVLKGRRRPVEIAAAMSDSVDQTGLDTKTAEAVQAEINPPTPSLPGVGAPVSQTKQRHHDRRQRRVERWETVQRLHAAGVNQRQIARDLGLARETVHRLVQTPMPPANEPAQAPRPDGLASPLLQPFVTYLQDRWQAGCHQVSQLYRELVTQGYTGSRSLMSDALKAWRPFQPPATPANRQTSRRRFRRRDRCLGPVGRLDDAEQQALAVLLAAEPMIAVGHALVERFRTLVTKRRLTDLPAWLADARASGLSTFVSFANGLEADHAAVAAALTTKWSNAPRGHPRGPRPQGQADQASGLRTRLVRLAPTACARRLISANLDSHTAC